MQSLPWLNPEFSGQRCRRPAIVLEPHLYYRPIVGKRLLLAHTGNRGDAARGARHAEGSQDGRADGIAHKHDAVYPASNEHGRCGSRMGYVSRSNTVFGEPGPAPGSFLGRE